MISNKSESFDLNLPILGIDFGTKKIGLGLCFDGKTPIPWQIIPTTNWKMVISEKIREKNIQTVIIGLPLMANGTKNKLCTTIETEIVPFLKTLKIMVFLENEYGTTKEFSQGDFDKDDLSAFKIIDIFLARIGKKN